ncbi:hypothetical protein U9M48_015774 [Paspalum notatum var. saurae]|uniref:Uncharacterized protein n=1 Tax=Paspalum notatum var. saurae TaxID=547442 RepID=A0AAQ3T7I8_PASNO
MDPQMLALSAPSPPPAAAGASAPASPYSVLHPLLLPSPNPHLFLTPKTLTLSLSSTSSLPSMASSLPPAAAADAWELVTPAVPAVSHVDGGLDDCAIFPPRLHEGLVLDGEPEEVPQSPAVAKEADEEYEDDDEKEDEECPWGWGWERCRLAARRAWAAGVEAVQDRVLVHGACGCPAVKPAVWSAAAAAAVVGALLYARRRDRRERDLLVLLSKEKDKVESIMQIAEGAWLIIGTIWHLLSDIDILRIAQLLHQIALMSDIRSGSEAVRIIRNS